jgi:lysophospholipase L1-like esterase
MRDPLVTLYVILALLPLAGVIAAARRHSVKFAALLFVIDAIIGAIAVLAFPIFASYFPEKFQAFAYDGVVGALLLFVNVVAAIGPASLATGALDWLGRRPGLVKAGVLVSSLLLPIACVEWTATSLVKMGAVTPFVPVETRLAEQTEDWRLVHVMSDDYREPDPVLLWRPVARAPYGRQRFKGPDLRTPKPAGLIRVMAYGDSNTDGPPTGSWPNQLDGLLRRASPPREGVNAGVTGYSSFQGLQRFSEEVSVYTPDVVLVSFGWNDVAPAIGPPDRAFAQSTGFKSIDTRLVWLRRLLLRYEFYLVARQYLGPRATSPAATATGYAPRVSLEDYAANLTAFVTIAREHGAVAVLLTRPYREPTSTLEQSDGWRRFVPAYNRKLLEVAAATGTPALDVEAAFADRRDLFVDECHFTQQGHAMLAEMLASRVDEWRPPRQ